ncbi:MAG: M20/M25/M40 family metallo-hydrolase [candidate division Zixibacteria bacterium]|nr:M20/M25/M40 family metallo-hydrolase [candidate division Zixibacteria bacterium]
MNRRKLLRTFKEVAAIYGPGKRERDVADYISSRLERLWPVSEDGAGDAIDGDAGNLLVQIEGEGEPVLFVAHMDTVEPCAGVKTKVEDGYVMSGGDTILGADDRAAVAALVELAEAAARMRARRPLELLFTVAEEIGLLGAKHADYAAVTGKMAFVFDASEPPGFAVVAAPGSELVTATFHGRAAHAGIEPEKGINAIKMAASAVATMRLGRIDHETTGNVGLISGGRATNIIPERAEIKGEVRSHDPSKLAAHVAHINEEIKKAAAESGGDAEISWTQAYVSYRLDEDAPPVALFRRAARAAGLEPKFVAGGGGSDANVLNARGIPSIVIGCGMENPHTTDERIAAASLEKLAELATALATTA